MIQTGQNSSQNQDALELGPWPKGVNNRQAPYSLPEGTVAGAVNGDFDNDGRFARRDGYEKVSELAGGHSATATSQGVFLVNGFDLCRWTPSGLEVLAQVSGEPMVFAEHNDVVFWTDGVRTGRIVDGAVKRWGVEPPADSFVLTSSDTTSHPGDVTVALSYVRSDAVESGLSPARQIRSAPGATVGVLNIPLTDDPDVTHVNIYAGQGEAMYLERQIPIGTSDTSFALTGEGKPAEQRRLDPPPAGHDLVIWKGRALIAVDRYLLYSDPFRPEHFDLAGGYIPFESEVELIAPVEDGIYVAAGATMYFRGTDPDKFQARTVLNYGAIAGTRVKVPNTPQVVWATARGAVAADVEGQIDNLQESNIDPGVTSGRGAAMIRESQGLRQLITVSPAAPRRRARR